MTRGVFVFSKIVMGIGLVVGAVNSFAHEAKGRADSHAPIGVMGDHIHKKGEFMLSYRHMAMSMSGNGQGTDSISDEAIATSVPNRFAMMPNMPPTLRIVPQTMSMKMDMLGLMYAPSDSLTLMLMLNYVSNDMSLRTYQGGMGTNVLGEFETRTSGLGDTKVAGLLSLKSSKVHKWHLNLGLSLPTGDIKQEGQVLTPMNMRMTMRLPYAMQLGSGSYDFEPGITYSGSAESISWGAQYGMVWRLNDNSEGYRLGNEHKATAWAQYLFKPSVSSSIRLNAKTRENIDGIDSDIMGPVQTADPSRYAADVLELGFGVNLLGQKGLLDQHRLALEYLIPLYEDLDGPQMRRDNQLVVGYQFAF